MIYLPCFVLFLFNFLWFAFLFSVNLQILLFSPSTLLFMLVFSLCLLYIIIYYSFIHSVRMLTCLFFSINIFLLMCLCAVFPHMPLLVLFYFSVFSPRLFVPHFLRSLICALIRASVLFLYVYAFLISCI